MVAAEVEIEPADYDRESGVGAHGDEEEGAVFEVRARVGGEEDSESGDGHCYGNQREHEAMFEPVGEKCDDEREDEGSGPGRDGVELCADLSVAVCFDDARSEEGIAVGGDYESEIHDSAEEEFEIFEAIYYIGKGDSALAGGAALIFEEAGTDVGTFVFAEPAGESGSVSWSKRRFGVELTISPPLGSRES